MSELSDDLPIAVFKVGSAGNMEDLVKNGHVFMNTASYYAELEQTDGRADPNEGASYSQQATGGTLSMEVDGIFKPIATLVGPVIGTSNDLKAANLYCLHVRRRSSYNEPFTLGSSGWGDTAVIFLDVAEFLRRVTDAAHQEGHRVSYHLVEYVNRESYTGPMGLFRKFSKFADQSEHRDCDSARGLGRPLSLHVGPLEDITRTVSADDHLKLSPKTPRVR